MRRFAFLTGVLAFTACQPAEPPPEPAAETAPMSDEDRIRARIKEYEQAYNTGDVATLGAIFTDDGDLVDPAGNITHGRAALEERWQKMFAATQGAKTTIEATSIRFLRPDIAIVDGTSQSFGMKTADGMGIRSVPGMYASVWVKRNDQWMLHCLRAMIPVS